MLEHRPSLVLLACRVLTLVVLMGAAAVSPAQEAVPEPRPLRLADYYDLVNVGDLEIAPDGASVVFTRSDVDAEQDSRSTSIWQMGIDGSDARRLVAEGSRPRFSPDGRRLAFVRGGQVWILPLSGGEPWRLTGLPEGVAGYAWAPDGGRIVVAATEDRRPLPEVLPADEAPAVVAAPPSPAELEPGAWRPAVEAESGAGAGGVAPTGGQQAGEDAAAASTSDVPVAAVASAEVLYPIGELVPVAPEETRERRPFPWVVTRLQFKADGVGYLHRRPQHLFLVEVGGGGAQPVPARRLTSGPYDDGAPAWSPDGRWIAFASNRTAEPDSNNNADLWVVEPEGTLLRQVTTDPGADAIPVWSPDSRYLAYHHTPLEPPVYANGRLRMVALFAEPDEDERPGEVPTSGEPVIGEPVELSAALDRPIASAARWAPDRAGIFITLQDRGTEPLVRLSTGLRRMEDRRGGLFRRRPAPPTPAGTVAAVIGGPRVVGEFEITPDAGHVIAELSWGTQPAELYRVEVDPQAAAIPMRDSSAHVQPGAIPPASELARLTELNEPLRSRALLDEPQPLRFASSGGVEIEGWLLRPPGAREGRRLPLVVRIHGGPVSQYTWAFSFEHQWLAAQGYAVLYLNPRGSSGYGEAFAHALWADWGGPDFDDVLAGVDHLVERGLIEPQRIGVGGWSYGGILTNYMITKSDRFAAAISGASETDYFACYGTDDLQRWWEDELGLPYEPEARALYERLSPIYAVDAISTPTLFLVGEDDFRVPASQSEQIYQQLRRRSLDGGPPTGLIVYPGQSHGIARPSFAIDRWRRYKAWYDRHLLGDPGADPFFGELAW